MAKAKASFDTTSSRGSHREPCHYIYGLVCRQTGITQSPIAASVIWFLNFIYRMQGWSPSCWLWSQLSLVLLCWLDWTGRAKKVLYFSVIMHFSCQAQTFDARIASKGSWIISFYGCSLALLYAYNASNTSGHTKKVTINAMTLASFGLGNIVGTETFLPKDAPSTFNFLTFYACLISASPFQTIYLGRYRFSFSYHLKCSLASR